MMILIYGLSLLVIDLVCWMLLHHWIMHLLLMFITLYAAHPVENRSFDKNVIFLGIFLALELHLTSSNRLHATLIPILALTTPRYLSKILAVQRPIAANLLAFGALSTEIGVRYLCTGVFEGIASTLLIFCGNLIVLNIWLGTRGNRMG